MLFRKKVTRSCSYCACGTKVGSEQVLCTKYGVVSLYYACRKFKYDLLKREPMARREMPKLEFVSLDDEEENEEPKEDTNENDTGKEI